MKHILDERLTISTPIIERALEILSITWTREYLAADLFAPVDCVITTQDLVDHKSCVELEQYIDADADGEDGDELLIILSVDYGINETGAFHVYIKAENTANDTLPQDWQIAWIMSDFESYPLAIYADGRLQNTVDANTSPQWTEEERRLVTLASQAEQSS